jgi:ribosome-binding protein aMBF1 (putative translation factor)
MAQKNRNIKHADGVPLVAATPTDGNRPAIEFLRASIARDIIRERRALGLTQEQLSKLAGIRQETLSRIESARHSPNVRTVARIDRALKRAARRRR